MRGITINMLIIGYLATDSAETKFKASVVGSFWFFHAPKGYFARNECFWIIPGTLKFEDFAI